MFWLVFDVVPVLNDGVKRLFIDMSLGILISILTIYSGVCILVHKKETKAIFANASNVIRANLHTRCFHQYRSGDIRPRDDRADRGRRIDCGFD